MNKITGEIYVKVSPANIDLLTKLIEGYDNLGIVSTIDRTKGIVIIRGTVDTYPELDEVLKHLPFEIERLDATIKLSL